MRHCVWQRSRWLVLLTVHHSWNISTTTRLVLFTVTWSGKFSLSTRMRYRRFSNELRILDQFCTDLCAEVMGNDISHEQVQSTLDWLERTNLFLIPP